MTLPDHLVAKMKAQGLIVYGPRQNYCWKYSYVIGMRETTGVGGIRVLKGPVLNLGPALPDEEGTWVVQKHEWIPGPGPTDFRSAYATAGEAVDGVVHFFRSLSLDECEARQTP